MIDIFTIFLQIKETPKQPNWILILRNGPQKSAVQMSNMFSGQLSFELFFGLRYIHMSTILASNGYYFFEKLPLYVVKQQQYFWNTLSVCQETVAIFVVILSVCCETVAVFFGILSECCETVAVIFGILSVCCETVAVFFVILSVSCETVAVFFGILYLYVVKQQQYFLGYSICML